MPDSIKGKKLNKGEWAEFYVMMKLLGEGKLYTANELLQKNYQSYLEILKILRQECKTHVLEYVIDESNNVVNIQPQGGQILAKIPIQDFDHYAQVLFDGIKNLKGNSIPAPDDVCEFAKIIYVSKPKAPAVKSLKSLFGGKSDIFIELRDGKTSIVSTMGFSIKSKFGNNPTLFNAGSSSQFSFKLLNCNDEIMEKFNTITEEGGRGWKQCVNYLSSCDITLKFTDTKHQIYHDNLTLVRDSMATILAWCIKDRLIDSLAEASHQVMETAQRLIDVNPLGVTNAQFYYEKAIKDFLMAGFTGMTAGRSWDGREQVNGGYIVVMDDGEVLCYHSNDRESFRDYLYRNTYFEYVSPEKYNWSYISKIGEDYYLDLNASIRFSKKTR